MNNLKKDKGEIEIRGITNVKMLDTFHKDFYNLTGLYTTFVDKKGNFITSARARRPFCIYLAKIGLKNKCDDNNKFATWKYINLKKPITYRCYAGLAEIISPIVVKNKVLGAVLTGQIKVDGFSDRELKECLFKNKKDYENAKKLYSEIPLLTKEQYRAASKLIFLIINYIFEKHYEILTNKGKIIPHGQSIIMQTKQFIMNNYFRNISLKEIADFVHISPYYLCHLFKEQTGVNIKDYVILLRINSSLKFLEDNKINIEEVANRVGYTDSVYFCKLFKRIVGISITKYRKFDKSNRKKLLDNFYKRIAKLDIDTTCRL